MRHTFIQIFTFLCVTTFITGCNGNSGYSSRSVDNEVFKKVVVTSDIPYREGDSKAWLLDIAEPVIFGDEGLRPAIIIIHGGGWRGGSKHHMVYRDLLIDYALQGYVTVSVGYRFVQEADMPACIADVKCAVRWLKAHAKELRVDPERIGSYGHSAGAHLSLMLGVSSGNKELEDGPWQEYSSNIQCAAAGAPPTQTNRGNWAEHPEWWPIGYISADHPPLLLLQGIDDTTVRVEYTDDYVEKMKFVGADIEYVRIPGNHGVAYEFGLDITKPAMDAFFAKHLKK